MTEQEVDVLFEKMKSLRCLIIGDVMVDAYIWGAVNRISPEAPVPVFEVKKRENRLGGAANVALNIQSMGATPILCGVIGSDDKGKIFSALLEENGLSCSAIVANDNRVTTCKTRIISSSHHLLRVDEEEVSTITEPIQNVVFQRIQTEVERGIDVIVFEDYDKGLLNEKLIQKVMQLANDKGIPTCVDPKKNNFSFYQGCTLFKPNFKEFVEGLNCKVEKSDYSSITQIAQDFLVSNQVNQLLITLSEHGMILVNKETEYRVKALLRNITDVSGAGDTVISVAALALGAGLNQDEIVCLANLAGGLVCEEVGVVPIQKDKLKSEYLRLLR